MAETKIILTQTVANLGHAGDVVEVRPGYARNYLFPQGLAFKWTKGAAAQIEAMKRARQAKALATREDAVAAKAAIEQMRQDQTKQGDPNAGGQKGTPLSPLVRRQGCDRNQQTKENHAQKLDG